ncbi:MAG: hypothetical protein NNA22_04340, partial [Nitrospira sp.]|nr:hypothetical protein [Nitrospira sp.]
MAGFVMRWWNNHSTIRRVALAIILLGLLEPTHVWALEKYGRPLPSLDSPSEEERAAEESLVGGYLLTGVFVHNPSFA